MKKFTKKVVLFLSPIVIAATCLEVLLRLIPNDYSYKRNFLDAHAQEIEVLILGSSHSYYGIDPHCFSERTFNVSHISQTIDMDYEILNRYWGKFSNLRTIVLPVDYFTLFSRLSTGPESWRIKNYNIYYRFNTSFNPVDYSELLSFQFTENLARLRAYYINNRSVLTCSESGFSAIERQQKDLLSTGKSAAQRHTAEDLRYFQAHVELLNKMIQKAEQKNIKVLLVTSPAFNTYVQCLNINQLELTVSTGLTLSQKYSNCEYLNLLEDARFSETDFRDADHLNLKGSKKLSELLNQRISLFFVKSNKPKYFP